MTNKQEFNKRHSQPLNQSNSKQDIAKLSGISIKILDEVYDRGLAAYKSNPKAPMSSKMSKYQYAMARVYSFVNKLEGKKKLNHDLDLAEKIKNKLK